jgi:hypothetical protein
MDRMKVFVEEFVGVHEPVQKVLPCVDDEPVNIPT